MCWHLASPAWSGGGKTWRRKAAWHTGELTEQGSIRSCRTEICRKCAAFILFVKLLLGVIGSQKDWGLGGSCWRPSGPSLWRQEIPNSNQSWWRFVFSFSRDKYPMTSAGNLLWCYTSLSFGVFPNSKEMYFFIIYSLLYKTKYFLLKFKPITG